jgi:hypothetical protein
VRRGVEVRIYGRKELEERLVRLQRHQRLTLAAAVTVAVLGLGVAAWMLWDTI